MLLILLTLQVEIFEEQVLFAYAALFHDGQKGGGSLLICHQPVSIGIKEHDLLGGRNGRTLWLYLSKGWNAELPDQRNQENEAPWAEQCGINEPLRHLYSRLAGKINVKLSLPYLN